MPPTLPLTNTCLTPHLAVGVFDDVLEDHSGSYWVVPEVTAGCGGAS